MNNRIFCQTIGLRFFQLTHGSFTTILSTLGQQALELQLERFFTVWAWSWNIEDGLEFGQHLGVFFMHLAYINLNESCFRNSITSNVPSHAAITRYPFERYTRYYHSNSCDFDSRNSFHSLFGSSFTSNTFQSSTLSRSFRFTELTSLTFYVYYTRCHNATSTTS